MAQYRMGSINVARIMTPVMTDVGRTGKTRSSEQAGKPCNRKLRRVTRECVLVSTRYDRRTMGKGGVRNGLVGSSSARDFRPPIKNQNNLLRSCESTFRHRNLRINRTWCVAFQFSAAGDFCISYWRTDFVLDRLIDWSGVYSSCGATRTVYEASRRILAHRQRRLLIPFVRCRRTRRHRKSLSFSFDDCSADDSCGRSIPLLVAKALITFTSVVMRINFDDQLSHRPQAGVNIGFSGIVSMIGPDMIDVRCAPSRNYPPT